MLSPKEGWHSRCNAADWQLQWQELLVKHWTASLADLQNGVGWCGLSAREHRRGILHDHPDPERTLGSSCYRYNRSIHHHAVMH